MPGRLSTKQQFILCEAAIVAGAILLAVFSAHDFAGGWNDGSRLATVECLVDHGTLAIDHSVFVKVPHLDRFPNGGPYLATETALLREGTGDKLWIKGHFYSDKSPVPAVLMAGFYKAAQATTGLKAATRPDLFCYWMTLGTAGLALVVTGWCVFRMARVLGHGPLLCSGLAASLCLSTVALTYARHVNNHIFFLGVAAGIVVLIARFAIHNRQGEVPRWSVASFGCLAGIGYTLDLGAGPVMLLCAAGYLIIRFRALSSLIVFALAALPWIALHHAVNYAVGGTLKPANAVPEYFLWPGCAFNPSNMTGLWTHASVPHFITYFVALLAGKRGFLGHNLPLFLALGGGCWLAFKQRCREWPELLFAGSWSGGTWLLYALSSTNYSGQCCSIRWFVPLLAPAYFAVACLLRYRSSFQWDFLALSGWGAVLGSIMWYYGPWMKFHVPMFWPVQVAGMVTWLLVRHWASRKEAFAGQTPATSALQKAA
jgi:hypothetical protein